MIINNSAGLKTLLLLLFLPFLLKSVTPSSAGACQCNRRKPPCEAFPLASTVFIGRVIDSAERKTETDSDGNERTYDVGIIRFEVEIFSKHFISVRHMKMSGQASSGGSVRGPDGCGLDLESA